MLMETTQVHSRKKIIEIILAFVVLIGFSFYIFLINRAQKDTISAEKQAVVERLQDADTKPLSSEEKSQIINFVSRGGATYSDREKEEITKILRAQ